MTPRTVTPEVVRPFARTLEQELVALLRGVSLECLVCGEFVMHGRAGVVFCPECGLAVGDEAAIGAAPQQLMGANVS